MRTDILDLNRMAHELLLNSILICKISIEFVRKWCILLIHGSSTKLYSVGGRYA
jgi:hypothetical protein